MNRILSIGILGISVLLSSPCLAVDVGEAAPDFTLSTSDGSKVKLADFTNKIVVLEWFNRGCPFVHKHYQGKDMQALQKSYAKKGVVWLLINSTNPDHQDYLDKEKSAEVIEEYSLEDTKLLVDADGTVGKRYKAKTTPHMFIIQNGKVVYQGAIDDNGDAFADPKKAKNYVVAALDEVLNGKKVSTAKTKPYGCSVKY